MGARGASCDSDTEVRGRSPARRARLFALQHDQAGLAVGDGRWGTSMRTCICGSICVCRGVAEHIHTQAHYTDCWTRVELGMAWAGCKSYKRLLRFALFARCRRRPKSGNSIHICCSALTLGTTVSCRRTALQTLLLCPRDVVYVLARMSQIRSEGFTHKSLYSPTRPWLLLPTPKHVRRT